MTGYIKNADGVMVPSSLLTSTDYTSWDRGAPTINWADYKGLDGFDLSKVLNAYALPDIETLKKQEEQKLTDKYLAVPTQLRSLQGVNVDPWSGKPSLSISDTISIGDSARNRYQAAKQLPSANALGQSSLSRDLVNLSFADPSKQKILDSLAEAGWTAKHPNWVEPDLSKLTDEQLEKRDENIRFQKYGALLRDKKIADYYDEVAAQTGSTPEQVAGALNAYSYAVNQLRDPVGANWQNLKSLPSYGDMNASIQKRSPVEASLGRKLEEAVPNADLPWQYYAWNTTPGKGGARLGDMNDMLGYNTQSNSGWVDFLPAGMAWQNATEQQIADAKAALKQYRKGVGRFDLQKAIRDDSVAKTGDWDRPTGMEAVDSPLLNRFDIAQGFLGKESGGKKNYKDVGLDINKAYADSWEAREQSGGFLGGMGGMLGSALSIAGMINPYLAPLGWIGKGISAVNAFKSGNPIGGALNIAGIGPGGGALGLAGRSLGSAIGDVGSISGNTVGSALVGAGVGGLTGGAKGALLGGAGPVTIEALVDAGYSPETAKSIVSAGKAGIGYLTGGNNGLTSAQASTFDSARPSTSSGSSGSTKMINGTKFRNMNGVWVPA